MNFDIVKTLVSSLGTMRYFPSDPSVRLALVELMGDLTDDEEKVRWLVKRVRTLYAEWPGEFEVRAAFCSRFRPKDGLDVCSSVYLDGVPSERDSPGLAIEGRAPLMLESGQEPSITNSESKLLIQALADSMPKMPSARPLGTRFEKVLEEAITAPRDRPEFPKTPQIITQADVDEAVRKFQEEKRAKNEKAAFGG